MSRLLFCLLGIAVLLSSCSKTDEESSDEIVYKEVDCLITTIDAVYEKAEGAGVELHSRTRSSSIQDFLVFAFNEENGFSLSEEMFLSFDMYSYNKLLFKDMGYWICWEEFYLPKDYG